MIPAAGAHSYGGGEQRMADLSDGVGWAAAGMAMGAAVWKMLDKLVGRKLDEAEVIRGEVRADRDRLVARIDAMAVAHALDMLKLREEISYWRDLYYKEREARLVLESRLEASG